MSANLENNFWKEFPEIRINEFFNTFYKSDKTKDKEFTSKIMWGIYLTMHPESKLYNDPNKDSAVINNFIKDKNFKWETYEEHRTLYVELVLTTAEKALHNWNSLMTMRDKTLKELYTKSLESGDILGLEKLDKILANTAKLFADYAKIKKEYEEQKTKKKGTRIRSLSDEDLI